MTIEKQQYEWFNNLPKKMLNGSTWQRECPCGATVWYEYETLDVQSWIAIHFNHSKAKFSVKNPFVYDWSICWKFSYLGFKAFLEEFCLEMVSGNDLVYEDKKGNRFVFRFVMGSQNNQEFPHENHYVTFDAERSRVNLS